jgi:hypothetical protein
VTSELQLPESVGTVRGPHGLRLVGDATELVDAIDKMRVLERLPENGVVALREWKLMVSSQVEPADENTVLFSSKEWRVILGVLSDIPSGGYGSPLDFGDVGYGERRYPDIGVSVLGITRYDLRGRPGSTPTVPVPDSWEDARTVLARRGFSCLFRLRLDNLVSGEKHYSWVADRVSLETGDLVNRDFLTGTSIDGMCRRITTMDL